MGSQKKRTTRFAVLLQLCVSCRSLRVKFNVLHPVISACSSTIQRQLEAQRKELLHRMSQSPFCRFRDGAKQVVEQLLAALRGDAAALGDCPSLAVALLQVS
jgi:hypothetical protein